MDSPVICVVDDDASVRRSLVRLLRSCGLAAVAHESAESYLSERHEREFSCVILDVHLGAMSGLDLRGRIAREPSPPPVIMMTAHDDNATRERIQKSDVAGFLRKPFEASALLSAIGKAIGRDLEAPAS